MSELEKGTGAQFDAAIVGALLDMLREGIMKNLSPDTVEENKAVQD